jgi:hypothetical protein
MQIEPEYGPRNPEIEGEKRLRAVGDVGRANWEAVERGSSAIRKDKLVKDDVDRRPGSNALNRSDEKTLATCGISLLLFLVITDQLPKCGPCSQIQKIIL